MYLQYFKFIIKKGDYMGSRIARIGNKFYDLGTRNKSFLQLARDLKTLGINNYYFMLEIYDYQLAMHADYIISKRLEYIDKVNDLK